MRNIEAFLVAFTCTGNSVENDGRSELLHLASTFLQETSMAARTPQQIRSNSIAAGTITSVVAVIVILSTVGKEYTVLQSVLLGVSIGVIAGLIALVISKSIGK